jgi:SAM-dependent methyltransferase
MFQAPAEAYDRFVGRYAPQLARAFADATAVQAGQRVLDVGCGPGGLTAELVARSGAENVAAIDPSEPWAEACRKRLPGVDVRVGPAEKLPFEDGEFDAVMSQLVVNFLSDAPRGVAEMARVTRNGGTAAACVWDYAGQMTMLRTFWDAAQEVDPERASGRDEGLRMPNSDPRSLFQLWRNAGLEGVETGQVVVVAAYDGYEDYWEPFTAGIGPAGEFLAELEDAKQEEIREECERRLGSPRGPFELSARAWFVKGRR